MAKYKMLLVNGSEIFFRTITALEMERYVPIIIEQNNPNFEEFLFNLITENEYADKINDMPAGVIMSVLFTCISTSGFILTKTGLANLIDEHRTKTKEEGFGFFYSAIIKHMPAYKINELKQMSLRELMEAFTVSELISGNNIIDTAKIKELDAPRVKESSRPINLLSKEQIASLAEHLKTQESIDGFPID